MLLVLAAIAAGHKAANAAEESSPTILFTSAPQFLPLAWANAGDRFPAGASIYIKDAKGARKLFPEFAATADPTVSFDGLRILFAGKRTGTDPWQIWEAALEDLQPRLVVRSKNDCFRPFYLPEDRIVFAERTGDRLTIENVSADGSGKFSIHFSAVNAIPTDVLRDGRILLTSLHATAATKSPEIFAVYSDGSGYESIRCDHVPMRFGARELASGNIVFSHGTQLAMFTSPSAGEISVPMPAGDYAGDVVETQNHDWIIASRKAKNQPYALAVWHPKAKRFSAMLSVRGMNLVQPVIVAQRATPNRHPSALHDWKFANLLALNVYTSKNKIAGGSVAKVLVYTQSPTGASDLLGESPVENDGSFYIRVAGDRPLRFELSDASGKVLEKEHGWIWARAGEQRVCVGCHAGPERAPENAVPAVLNRSTEPVDLTTPASQVGGH